MSMINEKGSKTLLSVDLMAKLLKLTDRRIQQLSKRGILPKAKHGKYDMLACTHAYIDYLRDQVANVQQGSPDYQRERTRWVQAKADLAAIQVLQAQANLLDAEAVAQAWAGILGMVQQRFMALPDGVAAKLFEQKDLKGIRNELRQAIKDVLDDLTKMEIEIEQASPDTPDH